MLKAAIPYSLDKISNINDVLQCKDTITNSIIENQDFYLIDIEELEIKQSLLRNVNFKECKFEKIY